MVTGHQNIGDFAPFPFGRAGVLGMFQKAGRKAFLLGGGLIAQNAWDQAHGGVNQRLGRQFAAGHDKIPQRNLLDTVMFQNALIDTFEAATKKRHAIATGEILHHCLIHSPTAWGEIDQRPVATRSRRGLFDCRAQNVCAQNHACATPGRCIIHILVLAEPEGPQVDGFQLPEPLLKGFAGQAFAQNAGKGTWKKRQDLCLPDACEIGCVGHQFARFERRADGEATMGFGGAGGLGVWRFGGVWSVSFGHGLCLPLLHFQCNSNFLRMGRRWAFNIGTLMDFTPLEQALRDLWPGYADRIVEASHEAQFHTLKQLSDGQIDRLVARVDCSGGNRFVVKLEPTLGAEALLELETKQRDLSEHFAQFDGFDIVPFLAVDAASGGVVMPYLEGVSAYGLMRLTDIGLESRYEILFRLAQWLSVLHRAPQGGSETYDAWHHVKKARHFARQLRSEQRAFVFPKRFLGLCALIHRLARRATGEQSTPVRLHGDPQLRNFILTDDCVTGIDVSRRLSGDGRSDLAWLVSRLAYSFPAAQTDAAAAPVSVADWGALEKGYGAAFAQDPVFRLELASRMLFDWTRLPAKRQDRSSSEQRRAKQLVELLRFLQADEASE